jgi:hypothetical protein
LLKKSWSRINRNKMRTAVTLAWRGTVPSTSYWTVSALQTDLLKIARAGKRIEPGEFESFRLLAGPYIDSRIEASVGGGKGVKYLRRNKLRKGLALADASFARGSITLEDFAAANGESDSSLKRWRALAKKLK